MVNRGVGHCITDLMYQTHSTRHLRERKTYQEQDGCLSSDLTTGPDSASIGRLLTGSTHLLRACAVGRQGTRHNLCSHKWRPMTSHDTWTCWGCLMDVSHPPCHNVIDWSTLACPLHNCTFFGLLRFIPSRFCAVFFYC